MATILIVEDNPDIAALYSACLSLSGIDSMIAYSIAQAKRLLLDHLFDAMLVDFVLRDGIGPALLHAYGVPPVCVLVSGHAGLAVRYPGFQGYLVKPVACKVLIDAFKLRMKEKVS